MSTRTLGYSVLVALICVNCVIAETFFIDVDKNECVFYKSHQIDQFQSYEIVWHGYNIRGCWLSFYAEGSNIFSVDDYKICLEPVVWNMPDCASQLYLKYNNVKSLLCTDKHPETICYEPGMNVDIEVKMHDVSAWKVNTTSFTLKVYAKDTTYYGVGLVVASVCLWVVIVAVCTLARRRRQRSSIRRRHRTQSVYSLSGIDNVNYVPTVGPCNPPPYSPRDQHSPPAYSEEDPHKGDNLLSHI
uniref:Uncharacterized protein LOC111106067 n=1 Tax=Crassostrea virginica TaxID=6565 RepID=A0A8B8AYS0_CRAVI|nr:uncharacterized protein LOC111106067 [Crassostrea virginica]